MSRNAIALEGLRSAPRATQQHLCREIVQAEVKANLWGRQGVWEREDWWNAYLDRLRSWHWLIVRRRMVTSLAPRLVRCPDCQRVQEVYAQGGVQHCFACRVEWLVNGWW